MCCFSRNVQRVADTRIFSRRLDAQYQAVAYQMAFAANEDLAMTQWDESPGIAKSTCKVDKSQGLLEGGDHIYRRRMVGTFKNQDIILGTA